MDSGRVLPESRFGSLSIAYLFGLVAITAGLAYFWSLTANDSLWLDELHSAWTVADGWADIPSRAAAGNQGPAYFWLVGAAVELAGLTEPSLRFVSLLSACLLLLLLTEATRRLTRSASLGLLAGFAAALDPNLIFYAREARPYAFVMLLATCHVLLTRWVVLSGLRMALLSWLAVGVTLFFTHYTAALVFVAEAVWVLVLALPPSSRRISLRRWLMLYTLLGAACLPALSHLQAIASRSDDWAAFVPSRSALAIATLFPCWLYVLIPVLAAVAWRWGMTTERQSTQALTNRPMDTETILLIGIWYLVPVGLAWFTTSTETARLFFRRYLVAANVPLWIATALPATGNTLPFRRRTGYVLTLCGILVLSAGSRPSEFWTQHSREDWKRAVQSIQKTHRGHEPIFLRAGLIEDHQLANRPLSKPFTEYCCFPLRGIYQPNNAGDTVMPLPSGLAESPSPEHLQSIERAHRGWLLSRGSPQAADSIRDRWQRALGQVDWRTETQRFGRLTLIRFSRSNSADPSAPGKGPSANELLVPTSPPLPRAARIAGERGEGEGNANR
jgi:hypothetical protein